MATDGDGVGVVGFVGLDDLSLDMAASLLRAGYKVQAFEVITRKVCSLLCLFILLLNLCCLVAEKNMEGHFHFVLVSWKRNRFDREKRVLESRLGISQKSIVFLMKKGFF
ncbi:hypothetical protein OIU84_007891 [Salix udensis]|uniref:Uncharacterized protein n=1 Tax=Salix udensis TaxID=889485 RepID=A0AAD6JU53_9ROSI|nr:hypothetical protein OIU84_007891 [Salix udensis]